MSEAAPPSAGGSRATVTADEPSKFVGGVTLIVLALIALGISIYHPGNGGFLGPVVWPRIFAVLIVLAGVGMASGQLPVRNRQDFYGGIALVGLAMVAMLASIDLPGMRGFAFGPGTAPRLFANMLAALGFVLCITGLLSDGPEGQRYSLPGFVVVVGTIALWFLLALVANVVSPFYAQVFATLVLVALTVTNLDRLESIGLRGTYTIVLSVFSFAIFIRPLGLVISSFLSILICAGAAPDIRWRETIVWAVVLTAFCSVLFPYGLNLPFQLWPRF